MGFTGILIDEADGGLGLGHVEAGIVLEEIGRNLTPSPFLVSAVAFVEALKGTAMRERWYPGILSGETVAALAIDEGAKHRPESDRDAGGTLGQRLQACPGASSSSCRARRPT